MYFSTSETKAPSRYRSIENGPAYGVGDGTKLGVGKAVGVGGGARLGVAVGVGEKLGVGEGDGEAVGVGVPVGDGDGAATATHEATRAVDRRAESRERM
jgi:hypothetical protein